MRGEAARTGPDLNDGFFEFGEDAFFLEETERRVGREMGREVAIGGVGGCASVDGGFAVDEVVWGERYGGLGGGEEEAELLRDEVSGEGGVDGGFSEDEAVVDGGEGEG